MPVAPEPTPTDEPVVSDPFDPEEALVQTPAQELPVSDEAEKPERDSEKDSLVEKRLEYGEPSSQIAQRPDEILSLDTLRPEQSATQLIEPVQQNQALWELSPLGTSLVFLGVFGVFAGLVIARRLIPGAMIS